MYHCLLQILINGIPSLWPHKGWKGALCSPHKQRTWFLLYQVKSHPSRIRDILSLGNTLSENITTFSSFWTPLKTMCEIAFLFLFRLNDFVPNNFCKLNEHVTEMNAKTNLLLHFLLFPACNFPSFQFKLKHHPWWEQRSCQLHYSNSVWDSWFFIFPPMNECFGDQQC